MVFQWKSGSRIKADAQTAGEMCKHLEGTVGLSAKTLVDANRDEGAKLHNCFEWDDTVAGEEYRKCQARTIIASITIKKEESNSKVPKTYRMFYSTGGHAYESADKVFSCKVKRESVLETALRELKSFKAKYAQLQELNAVFAECDKIIGKEDDK